MCGRGHRPSAAKRPPTHAEVSAGAADVAPPAHSACFFVPATATASPPWVGAHPSRRPMARAALEKERACSGGSHPAQKLLTLLYCPMALVPVYGLLLGRTRSSVPPRTPMRRPRHRQPASCQRSDEDHAGPGRGVRACRRPSASVSEVRPSDRRRAGSRHGHGARPRPPVCRPP